MSIEVGFEAEIDLTGEGGKEGRKADVKDKLAKRVYQKTFDPQSIPLTAGNGTLDLQFIYGPPRGFMMCVRRLTIAGYTAGTVYPYIDGIEPIAFPAAGTYFIGKGELLLDSGQHLIFQATGITGTVTVFGAADVFPREMLPIYLGVGDIEV